MTTMASPTILQKNQRRAIILGIFWGISITIVTFIVSGIAYLLLKAVVIHSSWNPSYQLILAWQIFEFLILAPGFGAYMGIKVYKKCRRTKSDNRAIKPFARRTKFLLCIGTFVLTFSLILNRSLFFYLFQVPVIFFVILVWALQIDLNEAQLKQPKVYEPVAQTLALYCQSDQNFIPEYLSYAWLPEELNAIGHGNGRVQPKNAFIEMGGGFHHFGYSLKRNEQ